MFAFPCVWIAENFQWIRRVKSRFLTRALRVFGMTNANVYAKCVRVFGMANANVYANVYACSE